MKTAHIRVMLTAGTGLTSRWIEWWGGGGWSHFANVLADGSIIDARSDVVTFRGQSFPTGVQRRPAGYLNTEPRWVAVDVPCTVAQAKEWEHVLRSQLGKPYDFPGILDFATGSLKDRNWRDESAWFCSELGLWAQEQVGICPRLAAPVFKIPPGEGLLIDIALGGQIVAAKGTSFPRAAA